MFICKVGRLEFGRELASNIENSGRPLAFVATDFVNSDIEKDLEGATFVVNRGGRIEVK